MDNIDELYEQMFGPPQVRPNIFAPDDVEYARLRQDISNVPRKHRNASARKRLPFEGFRLYTPDECKLMAMEQDLHKEIAEAQTQVSDLGFKRL